MTRALDVYAAGLARVMSGEAAPLQIVLADGSRHELPLARWTGSLTAADEDVLRRARGPVLDIGCGPGRHVRALARRGVMALGVDISAAAVELARRRGAEAVEASIFDALPGSRSWQTALLLDGNIGIGGHPLRLLRRVRSLLAPAGTVLLELDQHADGAVQMAARLEGSAGRSEPFAWARVGAGAIAALAADAGFSVSELWSLDARRFARLGARV